MEKRKIGNANARSPGKEKPNNPKDQIKAEFVDIFFRELKLIFLAQIK